MGFVLIVVLSFVAYGVAGVWKHYTRGQPRDPRDILAERYARGEIDHDDFARRMSMLTYGPLPIDRP